MDVKVVLDKLAPYNPGDTVTGKVVYARGNISTLAKVLGIKVQFKGKSNVKFTVTDVSLSQKGKWKTYSASETYFHSSKYLIGDGMTEVPELSETGIKEFPFSYVLPYNIPCSYRGTHGCVEYTIIVTLKRVWSVSKEHIYNFEVAGDLDINSHQPARQLCTLRKSEKVGMLWWSGTVYVNFHLKKKCYLPGEYIHFSAQIINDSRSKIHKAKLLLTQECRFYAQGMSHTITHIIKKVKGPGVRSGANTVVWEDNNLLKIPPLPPSNLGGYCRNIETNYYVTLLVQPYAIAFKDKTVVCKLPMTLGTRRGPGNRLSYPGSLTGSLVMGNRVGNIFGSCTTTPRGTMERLSSAAVSPCTVGELSYYQNVVFPLNRCFSAPLYQNYRFSTLRSPIPFNTNVGFEEEPEEGIVEVAPPTYEEAMQINQFDSQEVSEDMYQNSMMVSPAISPVTVIHEQPVYNNT